MNDLLRTALAAAAAGSHVLRRAAGGLDVEDWEEKGRRADLVTDVDRRAQEAVLEVIRTRHPGHGILAEEDGADAGGGGVEGPGGEADAGGAGGPGATRRSDAPGSPAGGDAGGDAGGHLWVVDPLDGTTNYLHGHPAYAVSVAVLRDGRPVAGAVEAPATGERWWAAEGEGAWKNGRPIAVSSIRRLRDALVGTGFPFRAPERLPEYLPQLHRLVRSTTGVRRCGAAALDLCYLGSGRLDAFWELELAPWDVAAGIVIVREAGGRVTRIDGTEIGLDPGSVLGANSELYTSLRDAVRGDDASR